MARQNKVCVLLEHYTLEMDADVEDLRVSTQEVENFHQTPRGVPNQGNLFDFKIERKPDFGPKKFLPLVPIKLTTRIPITRLSPWLEWGIW